MSKVIVETHKQVDEVLKQISNLRDQLEKTAAKIDEATSILMSHLDYMGKHTCDENLQELVDDVRAAIFHDEDSALGLYDERFIWILDEYMRWEYDEEGDEDPCIDDDQKYSLFPPGTIGAPE